MKEQGKVYAVLVILISFFFFSSYFGIADIQATKLKTTGCVLYIDDKFACGLDMGKSVKNPFYIEAGDIIKVNAKHCVFAPGIIHSLIFDDGGKYEYKTGISATGIDGYKADFPNVLILSPIKFPDILTPDELREYKITLESVFEEEKKTCTVPIVIRDTTSPLLDIQLSSAGPNTDIREVKISTAIDNTEGISKILFDYGDGQNAVFLPEEIEKATLHNHLYEKTGEYVITITVIDINGNEWRKSKPIMLEPESEARITASRKKYIFWKNEETSSSKDNELAKMRIQKGKKLVFSAEDSLFAKEWNTNDVKIEWYFDSDPASAQADSTSIKASYTFKESGVFPVTLIILGPDGTKKTAKMAIEVSEEEVDNYPKAEISVPKSNAIFPVEKKIIFVGHALDDRSKTLDVQWNIYNLEYEPGSEEYHEDVVKSKPDKNGLVSFEREFLTEGKRKITIDVADESEQVSVAEIEINIQDISDYPCSDGECPEGMKCFFDKCYRISSYPNCIESDNVKFIEDEGRITENPFYNYLYSADTCTDSAGEYSDMCTPDEEIIEYSCVKKEENGNAVCEAAEPKRCPYGYMCTNGECIRSWKQEFIWPFDRIEMIIVSCYGPRETIELHATPFHSGIDIRAYRGEPVLAIADGIVTKTKGGLNKVIIKHEIDGKIIYSEYFHNDKVLVKPKQTVKQGEKIALAGGFQYYDRYARRPHLHLNIREKVDEKNKPKHLDPLAELPMTGKLLIYKPESNCCYYWEYESPACLLGSRESQIVFNLDYMLARSEGREFTAKDIANGFWIAYSPLSKYKIKYSGYTRMLASIGSTSCRIWNTRGIDRNEIAIEIMKKYYLYKTPPSLDLNDRKKEAEKLILANLKLIFEDFNKAWNLHCEVGIKERKIRKILEKRTKDIVS